MNGRRVGILLFLVVVLGLSIGYFTYADKEVPVITISPDVTYTNGEDPFEIRVHDPGVGLSSVEIAVVQDQEVVKSEQEEFEAGVQEWEIDLALPDLNQGDFKIQVRAVDRSIVNWGRGNVSEASQEMIFDNIPPSVSMETFVHNLNQGGSGLIIFSLSKEVEKTGVSIGDYFFPAFEQSGNKYYCLFSFPYDKEPGEYTPRVIAKDRAGNEQLAGFNHHVNSRSFRQAELNISDNFLRSQMPQFESKFPEENDPFELFLRVNRDLREDNRARVHEIASQSSSEFYLDERPMMRKPNSSQMAGFADHRTYYYQGEKVDEQVHLGVDLASTAQAQVPAAHEGKVVFTGNLGIYGQTVILDHGLGLQTLYAHLSSIQVNQGQEVDRGQNIGRTGTTGLAVGDHLHFEVLISGTPVNPVEWWDSTWLEHNIFSKLRPDDKDQDSVAGGELKED